MSMTEGNPATAEIHRAFRELEGRHGSAENELRRKLWAQLERERERDRDRPVAAQDRVSSGSGSRDLTSYINHVNRFGPECVLETAMFDLPKQDVARLRAFIASKERVFEFKRGEWIERRGRAPRACAHCGLDLPPGASLQTLYHKHCRRTAEKRRERARRAPGGGWMPAERPRSGV
jgi:hypothetical protein